MSVATIHCDITLREQEKSVQFQAWFPWLSQYSALFFLTSAHPKLLKLEQILTLVSVHVHCVLDHRQYWTT